MRNFRHGMQVFGSLAAGLALVMTLVLVLSRPTVEAQDFLGLNRTFTAQTTTGATTAISGQGLPQNHTIHLVVTGSPTGCTSSRLRVFSAGAIRSPPSADPPRPLSKRRSISRSTPSARSVTICSSRRGPAARSSADRSPGDRNQTIELVTDTPREPRERAGSSEHRSGLGRALRPRWGNTARARASTSPSLGLHSPRVHGNRPGDRQDRVDAVQAHRAIR